MGENSIATKKIWGSNWYYKVLFYPETF